MDRMTGMHLKTVWQVIKVPWRKLESRMILWVEEGTWEVSKRVFCSKKVPCSAKSSNGYFCSKMISWH